MLQEHFLHNGMNTAIQNHLGKICNGVEAQPQVAVGQNLVKLRASLFPNPKLNKSPIYRGQKSLNQLSVYKKWEKPIVLALTKQQRQKLLYFLSQLQCFT